MTTLDSTVPATVPAPAIALKEAASVTLTATSGFRVATLNFKARAGKTAASPNLVALVPTVPEHFLTHSALRPHLLAYLASVQDSILRAAAVENKREVALDELLAPALAAYLTEQAASGRLSKESILDWLGEDSTAAALVTYIAGRLKVEPATATAAQKALLSKTAAAVVDKLASLASGRTLFSEAEQAKLLPLVAALPAGDMQERVAARIQRMAQRPDTDALDAL